MTNCPNCHQPIENGSDTCRLCEALTVFSSGELTEEDAAASPEADSTDTPTGTFPASPAAPADSAVDAMREEDAPNPVEATATVPRRSLLPLYLIIAFAIATAVCLLILRNSPLVGTAPEQRVSATATAELNTLFSRVREATLQKDIDLFMSSYSADFPGRVEKRAQTLALWKGHRFLGLVFDLTDLRMEGDLLHAKVTWEIELQELPDGEPRQMTSTNQVTLEKDRNRWRIIALQ